MLTPEQNTKRAADLGKIGESLAKQILEQNGFSSIQPLKINHAYADVIAERGGVRYAISVKARNKYEKPFSPSAVLNTRYKLGNSKNCLELAAQAEKLYDAEAAWLVIQLEATTYDAYFGTLKMLRDLRVRKRQLNGKGVMLTTEYLKFYECLAEKTRHNLDYAYLKNLPEY